MENNMVVHDDNEKMIAELSTERNVQYCSFTPNTEDEEILLFNVMNNPKYRLKDFINKTISIKDVFCEIVDCVNKETGEVNKAPRIVLIDDKGEGYQCVSLGIFSAIKKIFNVKGTPSTWAHSIKIEVKQITKGVNSMLTLNMVK
jgi:hypothetical protein